MNDPSGLHTEFGSDGKQTADIAGQRTKHVTKAMLMHEIADGAANRRSDPSHPCPRELFDKAAINQFTPLAARNREQIVGRNLRLSLTRFATFGTGFAFRTHLTRIQVAQTRQDFQSS
jgi:hypothetical protein